MIESQIMKKRIILLSAYMVCVSMHMSAAQIWPIVLDEKIYSSIESEVIFDFRANGIDRYWVGIGGTCGSLKTSTGTNYNDNQEGYFYTNTDPVWLLNYRENNASTNQAILSLQDSIVQNPNKYFLHIAIKSTDQANFWCSIFGRNQVGAILGNTNNPNNDYYVQNFTRDGNWYDFFIPLTAEFLYSQTSNLEDKNIFSISHDYQPYIICIDAVYICDADFMFGRRAKCGENLTWQISSDEKLLEIEGEGNMYNYNKTFIAPWKRYASNITSIMLPNTLTSVGNYAFAGLSNRRFNKIVFPQSVNIIGEKAFAGDSYLEEINFGQSIESIGMNAFSGCTRVLKMTCLAEYTPEVGENALNSINSQAELFVLPSCMHRYQIDSNWSRFIIREYSEETSDNENINTTSTPHKQFYNGHVYIKNSDKTYTITGQEVK